VEEKRPKRKLKPSRIVLLVLMLVVFMFGGVGLGYVVGAIKNMPAWDPSKLNASESTFIYDSQGELVSRLHYVENREEVKLSRMPDHLKNAFLATEDDKFYDHPGFRIDAIARAVVANIVGGWGSEGGSTITIQLVNHAFFDQSKEKKLERKIQELVLAVQMERKYTKDEILEMYLNRIYFDGGAYGVQAAAQYYFGKKVEDLELGESAMLAGLAKGPARYSPYRHPEAAKDRQATVLDRMVTCGYINEAQAKQAKDEPFKLVKKEGEAANKNAYQCFIDYVFEEGVDILEKSGVDNPEQAMYHDGLRIFTTMDSKIQKTAEDIYAQDKYFPPSKNEHIIQSAIAVVNPKNGEIKALVGGRKVDQKRSFNRATDAKRQPGSSFKPIAVYAPALIKGFGPGTVLEDSPVTYSVGGTNWTPRNYNNQYLGPITMRTAVQLSVNTYAVKMLDILGPAEGLKFAESMGISTLVSKGAKNDVNLSLALGGLTHGVTPLEMAAAYAVFANQGVYNEPFAISKITDKDGQIIYEHRPQQRVVMDPQSAYLMTHLLQSVMVPPGTGARAAFGRPAAGKTGTTNDDTNAWFVGYTPDFAAAVWMGYDNQNMSMKSVYGGNYPGPIWKAVMTKAHEGIPVHSFPVPAGLTEATVCKVSGKLSNGICPAENLVKEIFAQGKVPTEVCSMHVQAEICAESGKLATVYCPTRITEVFVKRSETGPPPGEPKEDDLPWESCTLHGPNAVWPWPNNHDPYNPNRGGNGAISEINNSDNKDQANGKNNNNKNRHNDDDDDDDDD
jgi:penicillin-binding protein 1A